MAPTRGCGRRIAGGTYLVTNTSPNGRPLEHFLFCPPLRVPDVGLSTQGQIVVQREGRYGPETVVFDHVGEAYYPNVTDFLEEGRRFGFSWHVTPDAASKLTPVSWMLPVHPRAFILNWRELTPRPADTCPLGKHPLEPGEVDRDAGWFSDAFPEKDDPYEHEMCSGWWWCDVHEGLVTALDAVNQLAEVRRELPSLHYRALLVGSDIPRRYERGVIARLPIHGIEIIGGGARTKESYERLSRAHSDTGVPVRVVEE